MRRQFGEGSGPRPAAAGLFAEPTTFCDDGRKCALCLARVFAAREDARPPGPQTLSLRFFAGRYVDPAKETIELFARTGRVVQSFGIAEAHPVSKR